MTEPADGVTLRPRDFGSAVVLAAIVHVPALLSSGLRDDDEGYIAGAARILRAGGTLYRDAIDRKPPLVFWAYEILVPDTWSLRVVRMAMVALIALNGLVVFAIARRLGADARTARVAGALAIVGTALFGPSDAQAANFEIWGLLPASAAILLALRAAAGPSVRSTVGAAAAAGVLVGVATNCKQPYLFTMVSVVMIIGAAGTVARRSAVFSAVGGFAAVMALIAAAVGWPDYWHWVWLGNGDYLGVGKARIVIVAVRQTAIFALLQAPLAVLGASYLVRARREPEPRRTVRALGIWLVAAGLGVASGLRGFGHYYQQAVPPLAILAAFGSARWAHRQAAIVAGAVALAIALFGLATIDSLDGVEHAPAALVAAIRGNTGPDDRVLVWGPMPDAWVRSQRTPVGPFMHQGYLTGKWALVDGASDPEHTEPYATNWRRFLAGVRAAPPSVIVDVTATQPGWERYALDRMSLGSGVVIPCYSLRRTVDDIDIWFRARVCEVDYR